MTTVTMVIWLLAGVLNVVSASVSANRDEWFRTALHVVTAVLCFMLAGWSMV